MPAAGNSNLYFAKDTKLFLAQGSNIWEIPVLNGFNFTQGTNTSEVTLAEMADSTGTSRRGQSVFTDSLSPAEWSFDTYARPALITGTPNRVRCVEEALWANFVANNSFNAATPAWAKGITYSTTSLEIDFDDSNTITLGTFDLYFILGGKKSATYNFLSSGDTTIYKISGAVINEATINFAIDGISTISWSGNGATIREVVSYDATAAIGVGVESTTNFIRNRLTQLAITSAVSGSSKTYAITLTGGSITISNNNTFLTPEILGIVNTPLGHVTGTRAVSGSFTCYMDEKTNGSIDLFEDLSIATNVITNSFALDFYVGGKAAGDAPVAPGMQFKIPNAHISIPNISIDDVIGVEVSFTALPSSISGTDEITKIVYAGT